MDARLGSSPRDYQRIGIEPGTIKPWEDGARTDGSPGTYEWWYFDAHLDDGAKLVVVFFNKPFAEIGKPLDPMIRIDLDLPDGTTRNKLLHFDPDEYTAATGNCEVHIGANVFTGDLHEYRISAEIEEVSVEVRLTGEIPAWRPETGYFLFGEKEFAWLPSVPQGRVEATYAVDGTSRTAHGVGYHDHNWGNAPVNELINHWYWARGQAGPFTLIASWITAEGAYGFAELPVFMLARDGGPIGDDGTKVRFEELGTYTDEATGKPVAGVTRYTYTDQGDRYVVTFTRHADLARSKFVDDLHGPKKVAAKIAGFDGAYLRFAGELRVEHYRGDELVEDHADHALWELMYLGKTHTT